MIHLILVILGLLFFAVGIVIHRYVRAARPEWDQAPAWAMYWTVDIHGDKWWCENEPGLFVGKITFAGYSPWHARTCRTHSEARP